MAWICGWQWSHSQLKTNLNLFPFFAFWPIVNSHSRSTLSNEKLWNYEVHVCTSIILALIIQRPRILEYTNMYDYWRIDPLWILTQEIPFPFLPLVISSTKLQCKFPLCVIIQLLFRASDGEILCLDVGKNGLSQEPLIEKF